MFGWLTGGTQARTVRTNCSECGRIAAQAGLRKAAGGWTLIYEGIVAGSGPKGAPVPGQRAKSIRRAFQRPLKAEKFAKAELHDRAGFCLACRKVYCWVHWGQPVGAAGRCPQGHFQSLDPHFTPDWGDDA